MKYLGINLTKYVQDQAPENSKTLPREILKGVNIPVFNSVSQKLGSHHLTKSDMLNNQPTTLLRSIKEVRSQGKQLPPTL